MLSWLISLINPLKPILSSLENAYQAKLKAENDQQRIEADKQIAFFEGQAALAQAAAQYDRWWSPRTLMAFCVTSYVAKIIVWDTVLQLGTTPNPGSQVTTIVMTVIGFYYGSRAISETAGKLAQAWASGRKAP